MNKNKRHKYYTWLIMIGLMLQIGIPLPSASAAPETIENPVNIAPYSVPATTLNISVGTVNSLIDGTGGIQDPGPTFFASGDRPQDMSVKPTIEFDYGSASFRTNQLSLYANYGPQQGVANIDVAICDQGSCTTVLQNHAINWNLNEQTIEKYDIDLGQVYEGDKLILQINSANLVWGSLTISEFKVWGELIVSAADAAQAITKVPVPAVGALKLVMPSVPDGLSVSIRESNNTDILQLDGTIIPPEQETKVQVSFVVTKLSDSSTADTALLDVIIPPKYDESLNYTQNLALEATASSNAAQQEGAIGNLNDGSVSTFWRSKSPSLPEEIELDFDHAIETNKITLAMIDSNAGWNRGFTQVTVEGYANGAWQALRTDVNLLWDSASGTEDIVFQNVELEKIKLIVKKANTSSGYYELSEWKVWGAPPPTDVATIASAITALAAPLPDANKLVFPEVPQGYNIKIESSDHPGTIDLNGNIVRAPTETIVKIVFRIEDSSDSSVYAVTAPIDVTLSRAEKNIARFSTPTTTLNISIGSVNSLIDGTASDADMGTLFASQDVPQSMSVKPVITFNFDNASFITSRLSLFANYGPQQSLANIDVVICDQDNCTTVLQNYTIDWKTNGQTIEKYDIDLGQEYEGDKIKIVINSANMVWTSLTIQEFKIWGGLIVSAANVAQSITKVPVPAVDDLKLVMPTVPDGFAVSILESSNTDILQVDGTIIPPNVETNVQVSFTVTDLNDSTTADTAFLDVRIPPKIDKSLKFNYNLAPSAAISSNAAQQEGNIGYLNDGDESNVWKSKSPILPEEIELAFSNPIVTNKITLVMANDAGWNRGVTQVSVEGYHDGVWQALRTDVDLLWDGALPVEDILFQKVELEKIKLILTKANLSQGHYELNEWKVWGDPPVEDVAASIKALSSPSIIDSKVTLPVWDGFDIAIAQSSDEGIVDLEGNIAPPMEDTEVKLVLKIENRLSGDVAFTGELPITVKAALPEDNTIVRPVEDQTSFIKNPAMGWVPYMEDLRALDRDFFVAEDYFEELDPYLQSASILYLRLPWSLLEPSEGQYLWQVDDNFKKIINMALERGLKLAFRINVDSQDYKYQSTPQYVFDAGAKGYGANSDPALLTPIVTDPVFREKFETFLTAFAEKFNDPSIVDYIDGGGLAYWGEMGTFFGQNYTGLNEAEKTDTYHWIVNLYADKFPDVLLGMQFGSPFSMDDQIWSIREKGFMMRRDAMGSRMYMTQAEKDKMMQYWPEVPLFAENCYQRFIDFVLSCDRQTRPIKDMLTRVVDDALELHANTLDLRHPEDVIEWVTNHPELVQRFVVEGGYRFVPNYVSYPVQIAENREAEIYHSWKNTAVGKLPNDLPAWNYKYKLSFALLNKDSGEVAKAWIDDQVDMSQWIKGSNFEYKTKIDTTGVDAGTYDFAVAIVDTRDDNKPAIHLAIQQDGQALGSRDYQWSKLGEIEIKDMGGETPTDTISPTWTDAQLTASQVSQTNMVLTWTAAADDTAVTSYRLYKNGSPLTVVDGDGVTSYKVTGLAPDTSYSFKVEAADAAGNWSEDGPSLTVKTAADTIAPTWTDAQLTASQVGQTNMVLTWTAAADDTAVTSYRLYKNGSPLTLVDGDQVTSYEVTGLAPDTSYSFKVEAADAAGNWSEDGPSLSVKTAADTIAPTWTDAQLTASQIGQTNMVLTWTAAVDDTAVTSYRLYKNGSPLTLIDGDQVTSYKVTGLSPDTSYSFKVEAVDAAGNWSDDGPSLSVKTATAASNTGGGTPADPGPKEPVPTDPVPTDPAPTIEPEKPTVSTLPKVELTDIAKHWAKPGIEKSVELGFVSGYKDGTFKPDGSVTRAEFATMIARALKLDTSNSDIQFADSDSTPKWALPFIAAVAKAGFISGYGDGTFKANSELTRTELVVIVVRSLGLKPSADSHLEFADAADIPGWARPYIAAAAEAGLIHGMEDGSFMPNRISTRAEAITLILSMLGQS